MKKPIEIKLQYDTKLIAHRGLSGIAPENTLEAFIKAGQYGYYGVECDIHVTKDREFIVFHDFTLERMTNETGFIKDLTLDEIQNIPITSGNNIELYNEVKIPSLKMFLNVCMTYEMIPVIEIKDVIDMEDLDRLIELLKQNDLLESVHIISFQLEYLIYMRNKEEKLTIFYLVDAITQEAISICRKYRFNVDGNYGKMSQSVIQRCHDYNILVNTYTVDDIEIAKKLSEYQIDYITTNILVNK